MLRRARAGPSYVVKMSTFLHIGNKIVAAAGSRDWRRDRYRPESQTQSREIETLGLCEIHD
jgi:hypothetical protein